jgi:hypothetical protein
VIPASKPVGTDVTGPPDGRPDIVCRNDRSPMTTTWPASTMRGRPRP